MIGQFKVIVGQQGQSIAIALLAALFGGGLVLGWI
jgi:hypothetical protein